MSKRYHIYIVSALTVWLALGLSACDLINRRPGGHQSSRPGRVPIKVDTASLWVEIADRPDTRQMGLMFRQSLPQDEGMLFVFEEPQILVFWMRNTFIPLDIAFISPEGVILNIESMRPLDEGPRYRSLGPARYAIEANQGWFESRGIRPGARVRF